MKTALAFLALAVIGFLCGVGTAFMALKCYCPN